jgi:hypothetical protein
MAVAGGTGGPWVRIAATGPSARSWSVIRKERPYCRLCVACTAHCAGRRSAGAVDCLQVALPAGEPSSAGSRWRAGKGFGIEAFRVRFPKEGIDKPAKR